MGMAGLTGAGVLCEICSRDGRNMATGDELLQIAETFHLPIITIDEVIRQRRLQVAAALPLAFPLPLKKAGSAL